MRIINWLIKREREMAFVFIFFACLFILVKIVGISGYVMGEYHAENKCEQNNLATSDKLDRTIDINEALFKIVVDHQTKLNTDCEEDVKFWRGSYYNLKNNQNKDGEI